ncbi:hypothetical protein [Arenibacter palladensis]|uniref:hypothetical protein n=1 Tax=Arenibacter palladensis TaxID=237373 RepID=UPI0026E2CBD9|nr:hypothetical protein [Arenibacter palladensis]MDO6605206.1 hypothetical protein [Arenibacter palladensis]
MSKLAVQFDISYSRLKNICKKSNIPLPNNGYWQKIKYGKKVVKPDLPKTTTKEEEVLLFRTGIGEKVIPTFKNALQERAYQLQTDPSLNFKVPKKLKQFHSIVLTTKKEMEGTDNSEAETRLYDRHHKEGILHILTDEKTTPRALRFINTLIIVLEQLNGSIMFEYKRCYVQMFGHTAEINLRQKFHRVRNKTERGWSHNSWVKTNKLEFQVGPNFRQKKWLDTEKRKIEECLPEIVAHIEQECKYWHDLRKQQAEDKKREEIERAKAAEIQRAIEIELARTKQLLVDSENWEKANTLRKYIRAYELKGVEKGLNSEELESWVEWSNRKADELDPLLQSENKSSS